jgi:hypothetical protein
MIYIARGHLVETLRAKIGALETIVAVQFGALDVGNQFEPGAVEVRRRPRVVCAHI